MTELPNDRMNELSNAHSNIRTFGHSVISHQGFTLIELLVASLLLGMLVMIMTMLFNSSSIAWRTGTAGVALLGDTRRQLGSFHDIRDEILPGIGSTAKGDARALTYRTVSLWQKNSNQLRTDRAYEAVTYSRGLNEGFFSGTGNLGQQKSFESGQTAGSGLFTVGVRSAGPNGEFGDDDDITTWPDEVF